MSTSLVVENKLEPIGKSIPQNLQAQMLTAQGIANVFDTITAQDTAASKAPAETFANLVDELVRCEVSHVTEILRAFVEATRVDLTPEQIEANKGKPGKKSIRDDGPKTQSARVFRNLLMNCYGAVRFCNVPIECSNYREFAVYCGKVLKNDAITWQGETLEHVEQNKKKREQRKYINEAAKVTGFENLDFASLLTLSDADREAVLKAASQVEIQDKTEKRIAAMNKAAEAAALSWSELYGLDGARSLWEKVGTLLGVELQAQ